MHTVTISEAQQRLPELVREAQAGEEVLSARAGAGGEADGGRAARLRLVEESDSDGEGF